MINGLMQKLKQVGGSKILLEYARAGVLPAAVISLLLTGTSQKSLELLRSTVRLKLYQKLERKYTKTLKQFISTTNHDSLAHIHSNKVWVCWLQGMDNAPALVKRCYQSLQKNLPGREIIVITHDNIADYVSFPDYIEEKLKSGVITRTHFSDILRLALLVEYGGTWIDATVLCTGGDIPSYILDSDLFLYQVLKPGGDGKVLNSSSWLISACSHNIVLMATQALLYAYWEQHQHLIDYALVHLFISMVWEYMPQEHQKIPQMCNSIPHILLMEAFTPFDQQEFDRVKTLSCFHKLTDKRPAEWLERKGTFYDVLIKQGIGL